MKELIKKDWEYTLSQDNKGDLILVVLCGSVALYEVNIKLEKDEEAEFNKDGATFLEKLVEDVRTNTSKYKHRLISAN